MKFHCTYQPSSNMLARPSCFSSLSLSLPNYEEEKKARKSRSQDPFLLPTLLLAIDNLTSHAKPPLSLFPSFLPPFINREIGSRLCFAGITKSEILHNQGCAPRVCVWNVRRGTVCNKLPVHPQVCPQKSENRALASIRNCMGLVEIFLRFLVNADINVCATYRITLVGGRIER